MSYIPLPSKEGWCVEGYIHINKKCISKYYLKSEIKTKEDAKEQFLEDTGYFESEFEKICVLECSM